MIRENLFSARVFTKNVGTFKSFKTRYNVSVLCYNIRVSTRICVCHISANVGLYLAAGVQENT